MGVREWLANIIKTVDTEYDRRIRRASNVVAYGMNQHHGHAEETHAHHDPSAPHDAPLVHEHTVPEEDDGAEIVNVPRGTPVRRP